MAQTKITSHAVAQAEGRTKPPWATQGVRSLPLYLRLAD